MKTAIFPGSFDPFTLGHLDVLYSSLKLFDKVIIAVGNNVLKKSLFSVEERVEIIENATRETDNVEICSYTGLTVDLCRDLNVNFIVRGLRTTTDFEMESVVAQANSRMEPEIITVFIPSSPSCSFISSTVVRDVLLNGGDATLFLPPGTHIERYLK
ncbi:MAG: pantetheine-phosphate adenylyltransferase [Bacteroidales bacterium]|jgi:pantetheine-phosphate adenylyltransferase|nr:pantetheine-phosphate adenylyltransferase [Bacteroidales bacterium]MDD2425607.1 pantetheine-phosphate adenylyltransferase [Bacteroidales bacterium]MDD3989914.1 pantetheine-phosphate adenylyltransferase [Bacteroidales bacterium]MDD4638739.1 pantetheine-phosphate adenylyltransferase [Bacteroidales bacterium]